MKIAVVIPSLVSDDDYLRFCVEAVDALDPSPDEVLVYRNDGSLGLGYIRSSLFDEAFNELGCDIALQCSSDFRVYPSILKKVSRDAVTTFTFFVKKLSMPLLVLKFMISPNVWTGCYSIPKEFWNAFRVSPWFHSWDGQDSSIIGFTKEQGYKIRRVRVPNYSLMRATNQMDELIKDLPLKKKIFKRLSWF